MNERPVIEVDRKYRDQIKAVMDSYEQKHPDAQQFIIITKDFAKYAEIAGRVFTLERGLKYETRPQTQVKSQAISLHNELIDFTFSHVLSHKIHAIYEPLIKDLADRLYFVEGKKGEAA